MMNQTRDHYRNPNPLPEIERLPIVRVGWFLIPKIKSNRFTLPAYYQQAGADYKTKLGH